MTSVPRPCPCRNAKRSVLLLLLPLFLLLHPGRPARAAVAPKAEYAVKSALVFNFARFSSWPDTAFDRTSDTLRIVVFGDPSQAMAFADIDGKVIAGRRLEVEFTHDPQDVVGCHLLYLLRTERERWPQIQVALAGASVLTIGEMNGFLESSGILNLILADGRIRFEVNLDNARANNIAISSRILKLAAKVIDKGEEIH